MKVHPILAYSGGRIGLIAATAALLYLLGFRTWPLAFGAIAISLPLSFFVLRRQRETLSAFLIERHEKRAAQKEKLRAALRGSDENSTKESTDAGKGAGNADAVKADAVKAEKH